MGQLQTAEGVHTVFRKKLWLVRVGRTSEKLLGGASCSLSEDVKLFH